MILGEVKYYDGRSPVGKPVTLVADPSTGRFELRPGAPDALPGPDADSRWIDFKDLKLDPPIGRGNWALRLTDGGVLECPHEFYDAVAHFVRPSMGARFSHRAERSLKIAAACFAITVGILFCFFQYGIPFMASRAAAIAPPEFERLITGEAMRLLDKLYFEPSEMDAARRQSIEAGFAARVANHPSPPAYEILFRKSKVGPNAFALPGGTIVMTDELVDFLDNDDQIYGVLAHELGHIHHKHGLQAALQATGHAVVITVFLGDVTSAFSVAGALPSVLMETGHSRRFEREADTYATEFAIQTGLEPHHLVDALEELTRKFGDGGSWSILSTHPPTPERVELIRTVAGQSR